MQRFIERAKGIFKPKERRQTRRKEIEVKSERFARAIAVDLGLRGEELEKFIQLMLQGQLAVIADKKGGPEVLTPAEFNRLYNPDSTEDPTR